MPFSEQQFLDTFGIYNISIWPAQIIAYVVGILGFILVCTDSDRNRRLLSGILALFWIWNGIFYHIIHFSRINRSAIFFGIFFIIQGLIIIISGVVHARLRFKSAFNIYSLIGTLYILYATIGYPLLGRIGGHIYPRVPVFGVAPCPTTIYTFGILLFATSRIPLYLLIIPFIWSLAGMSAAINLNIYQDFGLVVAGIIGTVLIIVRNRRRGSSLM